MGKPIMVVANVLVNPAGEVLLGLRTDRVQWECPGGKVDDENVLDAWHRELREETGIVTTDAPFLLGITEAPPEEYNGNRFVVLYFVVRTWQGFPQRREPEKCLMWKWFAPDDLPPEANLTPFTREFVKYILPALAIKESEACEVSSESPCCLSASAE